MSTTAASLEDRVEAGEVVAVRNPKRFEILCERLDARGFPYVTARGIGGWHVKRVGK